jgi:ATP-binding cassette subfamily B protein
MAKRNKESLAEGEKRPINKSSLKKLLGVFRYMLPYKGLFLLGLLSLALSTFTILAFPKLAGELLDVATGKSKYFSTINQVTITLLVVLFTQSIFSFIRVYTFAVVSERGMADVRKAVYEKIIWLPMSFFDSRRVGELMSRMTADVGTLQESFSFTLAEFLRQLLSLIFGTAIIFYLAPTLSTFMLLTFPILVVAALVFGKYIRKLSKKTQDKLATANVVVEESLQSISVVKAFTNELFEVSRYTRSLKDVVNVAVQSAKYRGLFISFIIFVLFGGIVAIGWYGASQVQSGAITTGELFSFVIYTSIIGFSIGGLGDIYTQLQRAIGSSERVLEILEEHDEKDINPGKPSIQDHHKLEGDIAFENVLFSYPTRQELTVLENLNFTVKPGEKIALVGPSGSGKSTIINLLMRFYPLKGGEIKVDGKNILEFNLTAYRQNLGIVPQEVILFGGTIRENISYGKANATFEEIQEAARKANALDFIENFPDKFDTVVGERGVKLSGGQRQRIAIARAILKDPSILILDEATSALDAHSESLVQEAMEKLMEGRTTIIIAHRLSTIKKADRIFVIREGKLAEMGSHAELTSRQNGIYSNLLKLQLQ